tara:strand:+ start:400 stop:603 length:204 start_codon:yes stop_codon:yes gene_type:complete
MEPLKRRGRSPPPSPPIYTQCYTFWKALECIPVSAAASKTLKGTVVGLFRYMHMTETGKGDTQEDDC